MLRTVPLLAGLAATVFVAAASGGVAPMPVRPLPLPGAPTAAPADSDTDDVTYDSGPARYIDKLKMWQMTGGVTLQQGDTHMKTNAALVNLDKDLSALSAKSLAPVHLYDDQNDVTADHGTIDFKTHVATLTDHITLIARPGKAKPGSLQDQSKDPSTMTCETILYDYKRKLGKIPGALTIRQKDRVLTADSGSYDGNAKTVTLVGHVHGRQTDGSVISTDKLIAGIAEDAQWIYIPGPIHAILKVKKDDTGTSPAGGKPSAPAEPAPPPDLPLPPDNTPPSAPSAGAAASPPTAAPSP